MSNFKKDLLDYSEKIYKDLEKHLQRADRDVIVNSNGQLKIGHEGAKKGSFIYLLYDKDDKLLYIGETGTSIKKRLKADGGGAHFIKNRQMFDETSYVKYLKTIKGDELSPMERKMIEQALTIYLQPKYYNMKVWKY